MISPPHMPLFVLSKTHNGARCLSSNFFVNVPNGSSKIWFSGWMNDMIQRCIRKRKCALQSTRTHLCYSPTKGFDLFYSKNEQHIQNVGINFSIIEWFDEKGWKHTKKFKSVKKLKQASQAEIEETIGSAKAKIILEAIKKGSI